MSLYLQSFIFPATPIYQGDSAPIFLFEAVRMLHGDVIYRDFFELTFPGTQTFFAALFSLLGTRAWIPAAAWVLLGAGMAWLGMVISRQVMRGRVALIPTLLFLALAFCNERDPTHHWFSTLAILGALAVLLPGRSPSRLAAAGALCAVATLFTQNRGGLGLIGFALYLMWEKHKSARTLKQLVRDEALLGGAYLLALVPPLVYIAERAGLARLFYCTIIFPMKYYPLWYWNTFHVYLAEVPTFNSWIEWPAVAIWLSIYALVPGVYLMALTRWRRLRKNASETQWDKLMLVNLTGLFLFFSVAFSPSWLRMCTAALPALVLFVWLLQNSSAGPRSIALAGLAAVGIVLLAADPLIVQTDWHATLKAPAGIVALLDQTRYEKFRWVGQHTSSGDYLFQASDCDLYFPLGLRNPAPVAFVTSTGYTRPGQVAEVVKGLESGRVRYVLWSVWLDIPKHSKAGRLAENILAPLRTCLRKNYHLVGTFNEPDYEQVWELDKASVPSPVRPGPP